MGLYIANISLVIFVHLKTGKIFIFLDSYENKIMTLE
jgi:hypothetical protein